MTIVNSICENMKVQQQLARGLWDDHVLRPVAHQPQHDVVSQVESHGGGTRWNPTQEQIEILEMLYARGMRTPNSHLIEQIALQLNKFGKIQGKNVFYWFQNHKARERQKLKRLAPSTFFHSEKKVRPEEQSVRKRNKCTSRALERLKKEREEEDEVQKTLELFPLHPEAK